MFEFSFEIVVIVLLIFAVYIQYTEISNLVQLNKALNIDITKLMSYKENTSHTLKFMDKQLCKIQKDLTQRKAQRVHPPALLSRSQTPQVPPQSQSQTPQVPPQSQSQTQTQTSQSQVQSPQITSHQVNLTLPELSSLFSGMIPVGIQRSTSMSISRPNPSTPPESTESE